MSRSWDPQVGFSFQEKSHTLEVLIAVGFQARSLIVAVVHLGVGFRVWVSTKVWALGFRFLLGLGFLALGPVLEAEHLTLRHLCMNKPQKKKEARKPHQTLNPEP